MIVGGIAEIIFGVKAERRRLEGIATPLTAVSDVMRRTPAGGGAATARAR